MSARNPDPGNLLTHISAVFGDHGLTAEDVAFLSYVLFDLDLTQSLLFPSDLKPGMTANDAWLAWFQREKDTPMRFSDVMRKFKTDVLFPKPSGPLNLRNVPQSSLVIFLRVLDAMDNTDRLSGWTAGQDLNRFVEQNYTNKIPQINAFAKAVRESRGRPRRKVPDFEKKQKFEGYTCPAASEELKALREQKNNLIRAREVMEHEVKVLTEEKKRLEALNAPALQNQLRVVTQERDRIAQQLEASQAQRERLAAEMAQAQREVKREIERVMQERDANVAAQQLRRELEQDMEQKTRQYTTAMNEAKRAQELLEAKNRELTQAQNRLQTEHDRLLQERDRQIAEIKEEIKLMVADQQAREKELIDAVDRHDAKLKEAVRLREEQLLDQLRQSQQQVNNADEQIRQLERENDELDAKQAELERELENKTGDENKTRDELQRIARDRQTLEARSQAMQRQMRENQARAQQQLEARDQELKTRDQNIARLEQELKTRDQNIARLEQQLRACNEAGSNIRLQLEACGKKVAELQQQLDARNEQVLAQGRRIQELLDQATSRDQKLQQELKVLQDRLANEFKAKDQTAGDLQQRLNERDRAFAALQQQLNERTQTQAELQKQLSDRDRAFGQLRQQLAERDRALAELQQRLEQRNEAYGALEQQLNQRNQAYGALEQQLDQSNQIRSTLERDLNAANDEAKRILAENERQTADLRNQILRLQDEKNQIAREQDRLLGETKNRIDALMQQEAQYREQAEARILYLDGERVRLERENEGLATRSPEIEALLAEQQQVAQNLRDQLQSAEALKKIQLEQLSKDLRRLTIQNNELLQDLPVLLERYENNMAEARRLLQTLCTGENTSVCNTVRDFLRETDVTRIPGAEDTRKRKLQESKFDDARSYIQSAREQLGSTQQRVAEQMEAVLPGYTAELQRELEQDQGAKRVRVGQEEKAPREEPARVPARSQRNEPVKQVSVVRVPRGAEPVRQASVARVPARSQRNEPIKQVPAPRQVPAQVPSRVRGAEPVKTRPAGAPPARRPDTITQSVSAMPAPSNPYGQVPMLEDFEEEGVPAPRY